VEGRLQAAEQQIRVRKATKTSPPIKNEWKVEQSRQGKVWMVSTAN
jgi:hypothetical protein